MRHDVVWGAETLIAQNQFRRTLLIQRAPGPVPGTVWTPTSQSGPVPLVLLGHGGSSDRHSARVTSMAAALTSIGIAAAAIDGPYHGERVASPLSSAEYQARVVAEGIDSVLDRMAGDWTAVGELLVDLGVADRERLAFFGLSMGTRYGLDAAALTPGLRCAVFGKFGTRSTPAMDPALQAPDRALSAASRITAPVLFHLQWDDELFPREGQFELFDAFASPAKELHSFGGGHQVTPERAPEVWLSFIAHHLLGG